MKSFTAKRYGHQMRARTYPFQSGPEIEFTTTEIDSGTNVYSSCLTRKQARRLRDWLDLWLQEQTDRAAEERM